ncbi:diguanylate phosphodiesterase [Pseudocitrobacter cyperus]|uniref:Diguanylate phosphodiesterase n=1 Tax=Pseudocitrobacter cyperus TaxID=3112843 RepID=A0ABV0HEX3_9ENTR
MLTTIIYRSHLCHEVPVKALEGMVAAANIRNSNQNVTGILLFNGTHFFQLLEGPDENVRRIYSDIAKDKRHYNLVELLCDHGPTRRFGNVGMELFDLREHAREEVLQAVLSKGTSPYQLTYNDRALQFFRTFVESTEKGNYFEIPPADTWAFIPTEVTDSLGPYKASNAAEYTLALQPIIDPLAQEIIALEALIFTPQGEISDAYFDSLSGEEIYKVDLTSKKVAFEMVKDRNLHGKIVCINLLPMTLVKIPNAVDYLLDEIKLNGLVPEQVVVEFTEHEVVSGIEEFTRAVRALKSAGISVAIDNFGAGFAGLQLLAQFQPDRIKINAELIRDVHKSGPRQAIVQAIIGCCQSLEIVVSALGIEKAEEWMWLESAGISHFQGDLFARPYLEGVPAIAWPEKKGLL